MAHAQQWYALKIFGGREKKIIAHLEAKIQRHNLQGQLQLIAPPEKTYTVRNGKKQIRTRNLLPGYLLVQADLTNLDIRDLIEATPDTYGFLTTTDPKGKKVPQPIPQSQIDRILGKAQETQNRKEKIATPFVKGETIKIIDGPFNGFTGEIETILSEQEKLKVTVAIFDRKTPLELHYTQVTKNLKDH